VKFLDRRFQIRRRKFRPPFLQKHKLSESTFPKQKIRQPLFAARSNQQIHFRRTAPQHFRQNIRESFRRELRRLVNRQAA